MINRKSRQSMKQIDLKEQSNEMLECNGDVLTGQENYKEDS